MLQQTALLIICITFCFSSLAQRSTENTLWYRQPANEWQEAMPVGNGSMGAMVFGGTRTERIQINESSIWSGKPEGKLLAPDYAADKKKARDLLFAGKHREAEELINKLKTLKYTGADGVPMNSVTTKEHGYETAGDIFLYFANDPEQDSEYRRELDLTKGVVSATYKRSNRTYSREVFCSHPDKVLVTRLKGAALSFTIKMTRPVTTDEEIDNVIFPPKKLVNVYPATGSSPGNNYLVMKAQASDGGVKFEVHLKVIAKDGIVSSDGNSLKIADATEIIIYTTITTAYYNKNLSAEAGALLDKAILKGFDKIKTDHIADHGELYNRVAIDLGKGNSKYPTDIRLRNIRNDNEDARYYHGQLPDPGLLSLFYQYNRYLLIVSSREGTLPPALHFWNHSLYPPWYGRPTTNINQQMDYWPAEVANLGECHLPMLDMMERFLPMGKDVARKAYNCNGAIFPGRGISIYAPEFIYDSWNDGGAWFGAHFYDHYRFSGDLLYLKEHAYPYMKEMALFYIDFLVKHPKYGYLVTGPSYSAENAYLIDSVRYDYANGVTLSKAIIKEILQSTAEASALLNVDASLRAKIAAIVPRLAPYKISKRYGGLQEWDDDYVESDPGHRHLSHLYPLFPGYQITAKQPELFSAPKKSLMRRIENGSGWTGWSRAWIICLAARLGEDKLAGEQVNKMVRSHLFPNMFATHKRSGHDVFSLEGNLGALAGMSEMLIQSHTENIELLPALPANWETGYVKGLCARGGFVLDIYWEKGKLTKVSVFSKAGNICSLLFDGKQKTFSTKKGEKYEFAPW